MEKICTTCGLLKTLEEFAFKNKAQGKLQYSCKKCQNDYKKKDYAANKEQYFKRNALGKQRRNDYLIKLRSETPCTDCKKTFPYYIMEFDHIQEKTDCVTTLAHNSWKKMLAEIEKCEIVCANCHRIRTHERKN